MKRIDTHRKRRLVRAAALACGLAAFVLADGAWADSERAASSRSNSGGKSVSSSGSAARAVPRAGSSRSSGGSRAYSTRLHHSRGRGRRGGVSIGYYGAFGWPRYYWGSIYGPYYPYGYYPYGYGYPQVYRPGVASPAIGALDLAIRPKKVEVWVDGQLVGMAGKFDGYPGYLWLTEGEHELVFYRDGYETVVRRINVLPGNVAELGFELVRGVSQLPQEVMTPMAPESETIASGDRDLAAGSERWLDQGRPAPRYDVGAQPREEGRAAPEELDLRRAPGSLSVEVAPIDASVYLDGRFLGTAAELARLHSGLVVDAGGHRLEVVRPGYASRELEFEVEEGEQLDLSVELDEL